MSFAMQALAALHILKHHAGLSKDVHPMPLDLDMRVASLKLASMGVKIDSHTTCQTDYLHQA
jgi:adenosylhomocysteinase